MRRRRSTDLVVTGAEDKVGVRVLVEDPLHDLTLVDGDRTNFEVLLADADLDRTLVDEVVLKQVLALNALELPATR